MSKSSSQSLTAYLEIPKPPIVGISKQSLAVGFLIDLGRFMERTGVEIEVTQVETLVMRCVCADVGAYTALRLAYGGMFMKWPRPSREDELLRRCYSSYKLKQTSGIGQLPDDPTWDKVAAAMYKNCAAQKSTLAPYGSQESERIYRSFLQKLKISPVR